MSAVRFSNGLETRTAPEVRAVGRRLEGYAAVFGSETRIGGMFVESVAAGAFSRSIGKPDSDVLALLDHHPGKVLARQSNRSLRLAEDSRGLTFSFDVPNTTAGNDALVLVESRLAGGVSFGFRAVRESWPSRERRVLLEVALAEISIVSAFPAYGSTSVVARARGGLADPQLRRIRLAVL